MGHKKKKSKKKKPESNFKTWLVGALTDFSKTIIV